MANKVNLYSMVYHFIIAVLFFFVFSDTKAQTKKGLAFVQDFTSLPYLKKGVQTYQYSSTDPKEDQFNDYFHWLHTAKDSNAVLADIKGPGTIYRIWSTGNVGDTNRLKIYIDGETKPSIDQTFNQFHNSKPLRDKPQVGSGAGDNYLAWWSYMPISFKKSIRIEREGNFRPFYNITYHTYTDTLDLQSWTGKEDYSKMEAMWNHPAQDPKPVRGNESKKFNIQLQPGESKTIYSNSGSGSIAALKISNYLPKKGLRIKMYWDGEAEPSVDAPLKWFFGSIDNGGDLHALGVGTVDNNGYCYFPMPFWKGAKMVLENGSDTVTANMNVEVVYNPKVYLQSASGYFHAKANEADKPGKKYKCLQTTGHGHVIGMAKRMPAGGHACEADEVFYIDNRKFPDIYGTGEEDYSNCAWWKNIYNSYPTHGYIGNDCYYRMHYPDMIVYEQALDMEFESWQNYYIASLVWYYENDEPGLILTDSIDLMNDASEKAHHYTVRGETWAGKKTGTYPGIRIYSDTLTDDGRSYNGAETFTVKLNDANNGARLRVRTDNRNFQSVKVFVDGREVKERPWSIVKNNFDAVWVDADFELPQSYTKSKKQIAVRLEPHPEKSWTTFQYKVFSYR